MSQEAVSNDTTQQLRVRVLFSVMAEQLIRAHPFLNLGWVPLPLQAWPAECLPHTQDPGRPAGPEFISGGLHQLSPEVCKQSSLISL